MNRRVTSGYEVASPEAASLIESLRAFGYELATAIADLVDNSLSAAATCVWIDFEWDGAASSIAVTDNGNGMDEGALVAAMRPGSKSPSTQRDPSDLGRFGLGLKTASFSQCRRATVRTKTSRTAAVTRAWDLDHVVEVNAWEVRQSAFPDTGNRFERLGQLPHGTTVVWEKLDRLVEGLHTDNEGHHQSFMKRAVDVGRHLEMVFHQLMQGRDGVELWLNDGRLVPWDPFLEGEAATQVLPSTTLKLRGAEVVVRPYVLPHHSKISKDKHEKASGPRGWNAHQGFYLYRNRRLIVAGDWLGFGWAKEEHYKLARLAISTPNALDADWHLDVTKSRALPPRELKTDLVAIAQRTRLEAKRVYSFRGAKLTAKTDEHRVLLWEPHAKHDKCFYRLNREHPLLKSALSATDNKSVLHALLRLIEETVPYPHIALTNTERPTALPGPFESATETQIRAVARESLLALVGPGCSPTIAAEQLALIWPFELFPALIASVAEEMADE